MFFDQLFVNSYEGRVCLISRGAHGVMLYMNANHAICDGRCLTQFLAAVASPVAPGQTLEALPDWKDMVKETRVKMWHDDPPYLGYDVPILRIQELCSELTSKGQGQHKGRRLFFSFESHFAII